MNSNDQRYTNKAQQIQVAALFKIADPGLNHTTDKKISSSKEAQRGKLMGAIHQLSSWDLKITKKTGSRFYLLLLMMPRKYNKTCGAGVYQVQLDNFKWLFQ